MFLAHDPLDNALAQAVIDRLQNDGVSAFSTHLTEPQPLDPVSDAVRRELLDSFAFVTLLTPAYSLSPFLPFYAGASAMQGLPTYVLRGGVGADDIPGYLRHATAGELWTGLPAIAADIRRQAAPFIAEHTQALLAAYRAVGVPVDKLRADTAVRGRFARKFAAKTKYDIPVPRVLRELVRLRKSGKLPRLASRPSK